VSYSLFVENSPLANRLLFTRRIEPTGDWDATKKFLTLVPTFLLLATLLASNYSPQFMAVNIPIWVRRPFLIMRDTGLTISSVYLSDRRCWREVSFDVPSTLIWNQLDARN
jgi:hypothetical protein